MTSEGRQAELYKLLGPSSQLPPEGRETAASSSFSSRESLPGQPNHRERLMALGQHVSDIAHELKNPLTIILLQTRLLNGVASSPNDLSDSLGLIQKQAQRMRRLVNDLLSFSGAQTPRLESTDLNMLILQTLQLERPIVADTLQIVTRLEDNLPLASVDPEQLHRAFVNLIDNACQAMSDNGFREGKLVITTSFIRQPNPRIRIQFSDNGPGIPPDVMPFIFEPFFTTKQYGQGTGLGLSICDRIVRDHGGTIWAQKNRRGGATLIMELPVQEEEGGLS
jgi:signal transduction histidine kinase